MGEPDYLCLCTGILPFLPLKHARGVPGVAFPVGKVCKVVGHAMHDRGTARYPHTHAITRHGQVPAGVVGEDAVDQGDARGVLWPQRVDLDCCSSLQPRVADSCIRELECGAVVAVNCTRLRPVNLTPGCGEMGTGWKGKVSALNITGK